MNLIPIDDKTQKEIVGYNDWKEKDYEWLLNKKVGLFFSGYEISFEGELLFKRLKSLGFNTDIIDVEYGLKRILVRRI
jgi:hypothetical protein